MIISVLLKTIAYVFTIIGTPILFVAIARWFIRITEPTTPKTKVVKEKSIKQNPTSTVESRNLARLIVFIIIVVLYIIWGANTN